MQQIINFLYKNSIQILFLLLLGISITLTIQSHSYHRSRTISSANAASGYVYEKIDNVKEYLNLRDQNNKLAEENAWLKQKLYNKKDTTVTQLPQLPESGSYNVITSRVISNSYSMPDNYLTINSGLADGVKEDMGVINSQGIVGYIEKTSKNYATVISILNSKFSLAAKIKHNDHFGSISWDGKNTGFVQLRDLPRLANVHTGDTIVTGGLTATFPENIPIGTIDKIYRDKETNNFMLNVRLFNDMTSVGHVYIVENKDRPEIEALQQETQPAHE